MKDTEGQLRLAEPKPFVSEPIAPGNRVEFDSSEMPAGPQIAITVTVPCRLIAEGTEQDLSPNAQHFRGFRTRFAIENRTSHPGTVEVRVFQNKEPIPGGAGEFKAAAGM